MARKPPSTSSLCSIRLENTLKNDSMEFNSFQSRMAEETQRAKENAERLANEKKDLNDKIRTLKQSLAIQKNENSKAEDEVTNARHTKEFLDKIAPPTWLKTKRELTYNYWKSLQTEDAKRVFDDKVRDFIAKQGRGMPDDEALLFVFERDHSKEELVENYDLEYEMYFSDTDQLIKKLSKLEEDNLALMNAQQEIEDRLNEEKDKLSKMELRKKEVESDAKQRKEQLAKAVQLKIQQIEELREGTKESKKNNTEDSFLTIGNLIKRMLEEFKDLMKDQKYHDIGQIDADDPKNKENILKYLKTIERLLIDQITGLRDLISQNQLNLKKDKDRRKQNDNKLEEEAKNRELARQFEEKEKRLEERNQARPTRKHMFKTTQGEKKVTVKPNNDQEEENLNRKYFRS